MEVEGKRPDDDIVSELCEPCKEGNVSTQADGYCNDCEEYMCQACFQNHVKIKLLRNHVLGASGAARKQGARSREEKCKKHYTESIKYYCRSHDSVACGDCLLFDHRKCEPEFIRDLAKNFEESSDFKHILKEVDKLENLKAEIESSLARNRKETTEFHDKAIDDIQKCRTEISSWLDKVTSKIEAEETEIWKENKKLLFKLEDWIKEISDMIDQVRDEINTEKYMMENLFIRAMECKSKISKFATKRVPEMKSSLEIKPFAFEPNQILVLFMKSANLGIIRLGNGKTELQISNEKRQNDMTFGDGANSLASSNLPEHELKLMEPDPLWVKLQNELETIRLYTKTELQDKESLLLRERGEREKSVFEMKECEKKIVLLKQEIDSLQKLNKGLQSQLDRCKTEFDSLENKYKFSQEQYHRKIESLQSELENNRENHETECKSLSSQIRDLERQITYYLPDPRASGFFVGERVKSRKAGWHGTVRSIQLSGYVFVDWDNGVSNRCRAGAGKNFTVKLL